DVHRQTPARNRRGPAGPRKLEHGRHQMALLQIAEPGLSAEPHKHRLAVGIDLGTTNSLVATVRNGIAVCLPDEGGRTMLASVVRYCADGSIEVGHGAIRSQATDP